MARPLPTKSCTPVPLQKRQAPNNMSLKILPTLITVPTQPLQT